MNKPEREEGERVEEETAWRPLRDVANTHAVCQIAALIVKRLLIGGSAGVQRRR